MATRETAANIERADLRPHGWGQSLKKRLGKTVQVLEAQQIARDRNEVLLDPILVVLLGHHGSKFARKDTDFIG